MPAKAKPVNKVTGVDQFGSEKEPEAAQEIEDRDDQHERRILEQRDEGIDDARNDELERLRRMTKLIMRQ